MAVLSEGTMGLYVGRRSVSSKNELAVSGTVAEKAVMLPLPNDSPRHGTQTFETVLRPNGPHLSAHGDHL